MGKRNKDKSGHKAACQAQFIKSARRKVASLKRHLASSPDDPNAKAKLDYVLKTGRTKKKISSRHKTPNKT